MQQDNTLFNQLRDRVKVAKLKQKLINRDELEREQRIKAMNLGKDDMYLQLLAPYKYERNMSRDDVLLKNKFTYHCKYDKCEKVFTKACNFLDHARMHEEVKPYECQKCSVAFVQH